MPELPEVERGRLLAEQALRGKRIVSARIEPDSIVFPAPGPSAVEQALAGRRVLAVERWGKQLWFELDRPPHPLWHFGMTGAFHTPGADALKLKAGPAVNDEQWPPRFVRALLVMEDGSALAFCDARRFGRVLLRQAPRDEPPISRLGFDPLLAMPSQISFDAMLRSRKAIIKSLLLDQRFCAGIGNWIADEVLFQARIDPRLRAADLDAAQARRLRLKLGFIVRTAVQANADDSVYPKTWLFHYRWGKQSGQSVRGGHAIEFMKVGGRTTAWVPDLQIQPRSPSLVRVTG